MQRTSLKTVRLWRMSSQDPDFRVISGGTENSLLSPWVDVTKGAGKSGKTAR